LHTGAHAQKPAAKGAPDGIDHRLLERVLDRQRVRSVYQPIIDLGSGDVAAYEALARGPEGSPLESPGALFASARLVGRTTELEWACRAAALQGALDANLGAQVSLFINCEPSVVGTHMPTHVSTLFKAAERKLRIVLELTERDLTRRPADLLRLVRWARERWWGVALDDVGADPESLALLPFIEPDVIKLDMRLIQEKLSAEDELVIETVRAHAARTGATVLAEGIETDEHLDVAKALGATLGQGWHFGRPAPLADLPRTRSAVRLLEPPDRRGDLSPFGIVSEEYEPDRVPASELLAATERLRHAATGQPTGAVALASFGHASRFSLLESDLESLAEHCTFVGVLGVGMEAGPGVRYRGNPLAPGDPLAREWVMVVTGPSIAEAVVATNLGNDPTGLASHVSMVETDDRELVMSIAQQLMGRVVPVSRRR
jgi:EAL domain-containing protein (putative c-di-GMP-specific phosphodiesterase class I)